MFGLKKLFTKLVSTDEQASAEDLPNQMPTVNVDKSRLTPAVKAQLKKDIASFAEIGKKNEAKVLATALEALNRGRDMAHLSSGLMTIDGMPKNCAHRITRLLVNRADVIMTVERRLTLGMSEAKWVYAKAPCMYDPTNPSKADIKRDAAHSALDGKTFDVAKGMVVDGVATWPGFDEGCKCVSRTILPD